MINQSVPNLGADVNSGVSCEIQAELFRGQRDQLLAIHDALLLDLIFVGRQISELTARIDQVQPVEAIAA